MSIQFTRAERKQRKFKGLLNAPSGAGKTFTALLMAQGLAGPEGNVFLLDTEQSSASLYADKFDFQSADLEDHSVTAYLGGISAATAAGADVLIIDSLSHAWEWLLEEADAIAARSKSKNSFAAWKEATPIYKALIRGIVSAPIHIIATTRAKTDYVMEEQERSGKTVTVPRKVGLAPIFRAGGEYEFDWIGTLELEHTLVTEKSRIEFLADRVIKKPTAKLGEEIREWLLSAKPDVKYHYNLEAIKATIKGDEDRRRMTEISKQNNAVMRDGHIVTRAAVPEWSEFLVRE